MEAPITSTFLGASTRKPKVSLPAWVQGDDLSKVANFYQDLEMTPFFKYVQSKSLPSADVTVDKNRLPQESLGFSLKWEFVLPTRWHKIDAGEPIKKRN